MEHFRHIYHVCLHDGSEYIDDYFYSDYQTSEESAREELSDFLIKSNGFALGECDDKSFRSYLSTLCVRNFSTPCVENWEQSIFLQIQEEEREREECRINPDVGPDQAYNVHWR